MLKLPRRHTTRTLRLYSGCRSVTAP